MEHHGTIFKTRCQRMREQVLAMKEIWTKDEAEFHGEFVNFDPIWAWPKPAQKPHPPILLGGESTHTLQRVVDFCDGWFPRGRNADRVLTGLAELKDLRGQGRTRHEDDHHLGVRRRPRRRTLDKWAAAGVYRTILRLPSEGRDKILPMLDQWAKLIKK